VPGIGIGQELQYRQRRHRLAGAGFADDGQGLAALQVERYALHRLDRAPALAEGDGQVADFEQRHVSESPCQRTVRRGSKASRTASPTKISRLSISASVANAVSPSHGACRLALPWASSSPSEA